MSVVSVVCCAGRGLCDELITHPEESNRRCCVVGCDLETSGMRRSWPTGGLLRQIKRDILMCCDVLGCVVSYHHPVGWW